jgi:hypothetical protein
MLVTLLFIINTYISVAYKGCAKISPVHSVLTYCQTSMNHYILLWLINKKNHPKVAFKWSSIDQALLPALSGVVKILF